MTSFQSELGDGREVGIAEELAESQRAISIAEFFEKNKHMLGFDSGARGLVTAVKEAVDNALDACEEADVHPDIYVEITEVGDYYRLVVEDNGPGITREQLPKVFGKLLYGSRFHAREQSLTPDQRVMVRRDGETEFVPIGVLCDAYLPREGEETAPVPDDIEVPSFDRNSHELTWQPVTHAIRHETNEPTYRVTTGRGRTVEVTGNHSLFSVTADGETTEVKAGDLESGDTLLAPRSLPETDTAVETVNLLEHVTRDQLDDRRLYVYGFDEETLAELRSEETVRRYPSDDSDRRRYYYQHDGVEILRDSLEQNYIEDGYLPAETVLDLGWEQRAAEEGCELRTYKVGGEETTVPVALPADESLVDLVAYYVSEGHAGPRQVGFTFGSHETDLIERTERAAAAVGGSTTTVERERNSTRVQAFGSPLAMFLESACGSAAQEKRVPSFVFDLDAELQRRFIAALYEGDGPDSHPSNELSHTTTSETLARQLSVLWNMQGVLASTERIEDNSGYADEPSTHYRTKVYGTDATTLDAFDAETGEGEQRYRRVPTSLLDPVAVTTPDHETVPDTVPGLLLGAGVGSGLDHAAVYQSLIEDALDGERVDEPRYAHNLREMGLLDADGRATARLRDLWDTVQGLQGITDTDMCLLPVREVEETDPPEYVYDISVPGATGNDENFVVANEGALSVKNSRGQQGIGISAAVLYAQLTSGKPAKVTSRTRGSRTANYYELIIDTDENEPDIKREDELSPGESDLASQHGTRIELEMEANMRARSQLHDYIEGTAVVNPHARIELVEPGLDEPLKYERVDDAALPAETEEIRPHPHGVELGTVRKMLEATASHSVSGFLQEEFTRVGRKTADGVIDEFRDRQYGRELAYRPPNGVEDADVEPAVRAAVSNKGKDATKAFARRVAEQIDDRERVAHHEVREAVDAVADQVEDDFSARFGDTVREKATAAAWGEVVGGETDRRAAEFYRLVDEATTDRKADATVERVAERLATRVAGEDDERDRLSRDRLREYVDWAADGVEDEQDATVGDTARENVVTAVWERARTVPDDAPKVRDLADDRDAVSDLVDAMRATDIMAPPTNCLSPIGADDIEAGLRKGYDAEFYAAASRDAEVSGGDPFVVEAGIAYGGELETGTAGVLRFANRVPLVYQRGACAITDVVKNIGWRNYKLDQPGGSGIPNGPAVIMVHVASTNVPFTSESKDAVANVPEIESEIELAVREAARDLKSFLKKRQSMQKRKRKQDVLTEILPEMAEKVAEVTDRDRPDVEDAMARIMGNVLVDRSVDADGDDATVAVAVENHSGTGETVEVTDIVDSEPAALNGATAVEMDGEYFVRWETDVGAGETERLEYELPADTADSEITVDGVESAKLTVSNYR